MGTKPLIHIEKTEAVHVQVQTPSQVPPTPISTESNNTVNCNQTGNTLDSPVSAEAKQSPPQKGMALGFNGIANNSQNSKPDDETRAIHTNEETHVTKD